MPEEKLQTLSLQVINGSELESGRAARCLFTQQGNVGHGPECHWSVQDRQQSIPAQAFTVILHDGTFCLRPQTAQLWLNQAKVTATSDLIQLRQGDEIQIGRLMVRVHLNRGDIPHYDEEMATPETIVTNRDMLTDTLLSTEGTPHYPGMTHRHQLADTVVNGFSADPLQALQSESLITTGDPLSGIAAVRPSAPLSDPASNGGINTPFMDLPPIYASPGDRNDDVSAAEMAQRHLAVTPLLRGLGGSLTMSNSDDADDFLEEAGRTLQAAIKGLLDLQQQRNSLSDKHLRPLEDNPLRLNMDYATALDVMFAEGKSPVHLAAPAAVSESLRNVRHHEEANRAAIVESLRVLLDAFSPQNLLRRFVQYRKSNGRYIPYCRQERSICRCICVTVSGRPISMTQNCCNLPPLCWPWRQTCRSIRSSVSLSSSRKFPRRKKSAIWSVCRSPVFHCVPLWWLPASFLTIPGSAISNSTRADRPGQKWLPPGPLHCMYPAVSRI